MNMVLPSISVTYKQVHYQLTAPIFDLQKYSYMFQVQPVAILSDLQCSKTKTHTALLCDLLIVIFKNTYSFVT